MDFVCIQLNELVIVIAVTTLYIFIPLQISVQRTTRKVIQVLCAKIINSLITTISKLSKIFKIGTNGRYIINFNNYAINSFKNVYSKLYNFGFILLLLFITPGNSYIALLYAFGNIYYYGNKYIFLEINPNSIS